MKLLIRKFQRNYKDYGLEIAWRKTMAYLFGFIYISRVYRIYMIDLRGFIAKPHKEGKFTFRFIDKHDVRCVEQIEAMEEWLEGNVAKIIGNDGLCLVAMDNGTVAGFNLVEMGEVYMPLVRKKRVFRPGEAWSVQITVNNGYREKGLGSELRFRMFAELKARGYKKFYGGTLSKNEANLNLTRKVGFKEIADIEYISFLNFRRRRVRRAK